MSRRERGGATIFVLGMSLVLMLCAGLVIDGGMGINARMRVADDAEQAARAGANAVNVDQLRSGGALAVDPGLARLYAQDFLSARGYPASQFSITVNASSGRQRRSTGPKPPRDRASGNRISPPMAVRRNTSVPGGTSRTATRISK